ncbi:heme-binding protein [Variovorax sp. J2P1-59]|uniref:GlcG/HbpS family heme-binding protein n=1 Tax=Variovorax flavidus TaxID=3053501 RepID=UPI00257915F5|nr:heme-binding protein [Variovorax sp. J2P1-59]MDM0078416.1 heme-binding protein [Variovorax sp. J2P1-59]
MTSVSHIIPYGPPLSLDAARKVASAAEAEAKANGWPMVIAVMYSGSNLVLLHKMDQAQTGSVTIAQAKAESAVRFKRPTKVFEEALTTGGINLRLLATHGACPLEGGLPLMVGGQLVGAIGVSGMQSTQDAQVAAVGAKAMADADSLAMH